MLFEEALPKIRNGIRFKINHGDLNNAIYYKFNDLRDNSSLLSSAFEFGVVLEPTKVIKYQYLVREQWKYAYNHVTIHITNEELETLSKNYLYTRIDSTKLEMEK